MHARKETVTIILLDADFMRIFYDYGWNPVFFEGKMKRSFQHRLKDFFKTQKGQACS
jgi:hypothetical protein